MSSEYSIPATGASTKLRLSSSLPQEYDALVVPVFKGEEGLELAATNLLEQDFSIAIWELLSAVGATGQASEITRVPAVEGMDADFVVGVGLGNSEEVTDEVIRKACGAAARALKGVQTVVTTIGDFGLAAAVEGFGLGAYHYRGLRAEEEKASQAPVKKVVFVSEKKRAKEEFATAKEVVAAVNLARDFTNTPSSHLFPESYAAILSDLAKEAGVKVEVLDEKELKKQGFGGLIAVGSGSARGPRLVQLRYAPKKAKTHVAMVGKGITFDTGGISIKPGLNMQNMVSDMAGSAAVAASILAAAKLGLKVKITATLPLAENMPDGLAYRPGDVITHYGGTTSEILNTDAEGRLVLADALVKASEDKPDYLIETATLTGAQLVALGLRTYGVMGSDEFRDRIAAAGNEVGELAWPMPLPEELDEGLKSEVADLRNTGNSRFGGMLTAGAYLSHFVGEGIQWAHLDIAGPSYNTSGKAYGYTPTRGTGVPVRTFLKILSDLAE